MISAARVGAIVLAAGASSRFGGQKLLAPLKGRPLLEHVLGTVAGFSFGETVVVLGRDATELEGRVAWGSERRVLNPTPEAGLSSSLRIGLGALGPGSEAALVLLGDQPLVRPAVIESLLEAFVRAGPPVVVPRYADEGGRNPVLVGRAAWPLAAEATGDRGLAPLLAAQPRLVREVPVSGANRDVDTPADLAALHSRTGES